MEAEKARDEVEQHGQDVGVAETEEILRAKVLAVCQTYCAQTWDEALNRAGVEASSELRRLENIYYPAAIRASDLLFKVKLPLQLLTLLKKHNFRILFLPVSKSKQNNLKLLRKYPRIRLQRFHKMGQLPKVLNRPYLQLPCLPRKPPKRKKK